MIPKANARGHSFKGVIAYLMHDKDRAKTSERVAWYETGNLSTNDPEKAAKVMAWTDLNADYLKHLNGGSKAGTKVQAGGVYHFSLAWKDGDPSQEHQKEQALVALEGLKLETHEHVMVAHNDTAHPHIHVVVNLTHPETGKRNSLTQDQRALQKFALDYERKHGIECHAREANAQRFEATGKPTKHRDKKQDYSTKVTRAFQLSDNGQSFVQALKAEGLQLAPARRRSEFVIVDQKGDVQKLTRQLDPVDKYQTPITGREKGDLIRERLKDVDRSTLPDADELSKQIKAELEQAQQAKTKAQEERQATLTEDFERTAKAQNIPEPIQDLQEQFKANAEVEKQPQQPEEKPKTKDPPEKNIVTNWPVPSFASSYRDNDEELLEMSRLKERIEEKRHYWQIPKLEKQKQQAEQHLKTREGWFDRIFRRGRYEEAKHEAWAKAKNLDHARQRWRADIEAIYSKREPDFINAQLEKYGFAPKPPEHTQEHQHDLTSVNDNAQKPEPQQQKPEDREPQSANDNQIKGDGLKEEFTETQQDKTRSQMLEELIEQQSEELKQEHTLRR